MAKKRIRGEENISGVDPRMKKLVKSFADKLAMEDPDAYVALGEDSGLRTSEDRQKQLQAAGKSDAGTLKSTPHGSGEGVDVLIAKGGKAVSDEDPRYKEFGDMAKQRGMKWGGDFKKLYDPGHAEIDNWAKEGPLPEHERVAQEMTVDLPDDLGVNDPEEFENPFAKNEQKLRSFVIEPPVMEGGGFTDSNGASSYSVPTSPVDYRGDELASRVAPNSGRFGNSARAVLSGGGKTDYLAAGEQLRMTPEDATKLTLNSAGFDENGDPLAIPDNIKSYVSKLREPEQAAPELPTDIEVKEPQEEVQQPSPESAQTGMDLEQLRARIQDAMHKDSWGKLGINVGRQLADVGASLAGVKNTTGSFYDQLDEGSNKHVNALKSELAYEDTLAKRENLKADNEMARQRDEAMIANAKAKTDDTAGYRKRMGDQRDKALELREQEMEQREDQFGARQQQQIAAKVPKGASRAIDIIGQIKSKYTGQAGRLVGRLPKEMRDSAANEIRQLAELVYNPYRHSLFGAALTSEESAAFNAAVGAMRSGATDEEFMRGLNEIERSMKASLREVYAGAPDAAKAYISAGGPEIPGDSFFSREAISGGQMAQPEAPNGSPGPEWVRGSANGQSGWVKRLGNGKVQFRADGSAQ